MIPRIMMGHADHLLDREDVDCKGIVELRALPNLCIVLEHRACPAVSILNSFWLPNIFVAGRVARGPHLRVFSVVFLHTVIHADCFVRSASVHSWISLKRETKSVCVRHRSSICTHLPLQLVSSLRFVGAVGGTSSHAVCDCRHSISVPHRVLADRSRHPSLGSYGTWIRETQKKMRFSVINTIRVHGDSFPES